MHHYLPLADQLNILFEFVTDDDGASYSMQDVSQNIDVSLATLSQLRNGKIKNPQLNTLREICRFFGVPLSYFETTSPEDCYAILGENEVITPQLSEIALRSRQLSPETQRDVRNMIKWAQAAEHEREVDANFPPLPALQEDGNGHI